MSVTRGTLFSFDPPSSLREVSPKGAEGVSEVTMQTIRFSPGSIPVTGSYDVLVAGGGTAGAFAGISAARMGARTLIVEQYGAPGGSQTMALVTPIMHSHITGDPQSSALADEVRGRMAKLGAAIDEGDADKGWFDPLALKFVLEQMIAESGCEILYHTALISTINDGNRLTHAVVYNDDGINALAAKQFVDCTGDGDLSVMAGAGFESGNDKGFNQAVSLRFQMTNIDIDCFRRYLKSLGEDHVEKSLTFHTATTYHNYRWALTKVFDKAFNDGLMTIQDIKYFQCFSVPGKPRDLAFNCPELGSAKKTLDARYLSGKQTEGRKAIGRITKFLRERIPGFESSYLSEIAPMLGIRETRRIETEYMVTGQDVLNYARFDDYIATSNYPVDIHDAGEEEGLKFEYRDPGECYYHIPFRSLVVAGLDNLYVAGRCLGADFVAQSTIRTQHACRASGEAAGIGAAMAARQAVRAKDIDGACVRAVMLERGAKFL